MLGGQGYFRGSSVLVSGTAGTGKTSLAATFADAACRRGERCLYFAFEESQSQIVRNMRIDRARPRAARPSSGLLPFRDRPPDVARPGDAPGDHAPDGPRLPAAASSSSTRSRNFVSVGASDRDQGDADAADRLPQGPPDHRPLHQPDRTAAAPWSRPTSAISSLIDTWLLLRDIEVDGERNRVLYVLKSRGMAHSNQIREFLITPRGIELVDVYIGPDGC